MTEIKTGGSAFPNPCLADEAYAAQPGDYGMTLRDWFAGQALSNSYTFCENNPDKAADWAYQIADAMIAAREGGAA